MITRYLCKACERPFRHAGHTPICPYCGAANFVIFPYIKGTGQRPVVVQSVYLGGYQMDTTRWAREAALYL